MHDGGWLELDVTGVVTASTVARTLQCRMAPDHPVRMHHLVMVVLIAAIVGNPEPLSNDRRLQHSGSFPRLVPAASARVGLPPVRSLVGAHSHTDGSITRCSTYQGWTRRGPHLAQAPTQH